MSMLKRRGFVKRAARAMRPFRDSSAKVHVYRKDPVACASKQMWIQRWLFGIMWTPSSRDLGCQANGTEPAQPASGNITH